MYNIKDSSPILTNCNFCGNTDGEGFSSLYGDEIHGSSSGNGILNAECVYGDINCDGVANYADRKAMNMFLGVCDADINGDGEVNRVDLAYVLGYWGLCSAP